MSLRPVKRLIKSKPTPYGGRAILM